MRQGSETPTKTEAVKVTGGPAGLTEPRQPQISPILGLQGNEASPAVPPVPPDSALRGASPPLPSSPLPSSFSSRSVCGQAGPAEWSGRPAPRELPLGREPAKRKRPLARPAPSLPDHDRQRTLQRPRPIIDHAPRNSHRLAP
ncbi:uncharacterized protein LOC132495410 [Mesoplodon densirostris]|uniref:uncharacterized protein LOC132495410 n=1 Tax=Mesoplodon densirostris TaxID=48708 RepID=UPI0028DD0D3D|nr:uncharacterized protein LOC132495410 [Mesoplodon densirostris]